MKNIISFIFAAVLGVILTGCGGGGGSPSTQPTTELNRGRNSAAGEGITVGFSPNNIPANLGVRAGNADIVINGVIAGSRFKITVNIGTVAITIPMVVFVQNGTNYVANPCINTNDIVCQLQDASGNAISDPRQFRWEIGNYSVTNIFYFNRGLIENAHRFGNFYIKAEDKHAEYRWTPFSDVFIDGGFRRFGNADVAYAKMQMDYKDFYLQYTAGNIRSDYYQEGNINGVAFGWQKNGFAIKAEKPFGNGGEKTVRLFYQRELK